MKEALLWDKASGGAVICKLCAHKCRIAPDRRGICTVRANDGGVLRTCVYGRAIAEHVDPVEKKPLYHFLPSSETYSVATVGCNFKCAFCQNWGISQSAGLRKDDVERIDQSGIAMPPQRVVDVALKYMCRSISFTYTEPTVFFEYALDTARIAKDAGLKTVFVSNGYMSKECIDAVAPYLDACNIDLKSFSDGFYKTHCGASLYPVLESLKAIREAGIWLEVTTLVIAGENDSDEELAGIARFIADELGRDTPWHVSRFFPQYHMSDRLATGVQSIDRALNLGRGAGLRYVYAGNVDLAQDTLCPKCGETVMRRQGYRTDADGLSTDGGAGRCRGCGAEICGIF
ncbi:MAG: AmmeMemoRadiSam system radical SAM enzyme [Chitinispirillales bacterium]|jgi:pyruvate formate lyase activating enzyme|nr:AmmeMemoRadiSam system radical SAM enzyme [Chitinispirillales bacterium]